MIRNKSLPSVSISDIKVGYKASLWRCMTKLSYMNKLDAIRKPAFPLSVTLLEQIYKDSTQYGNNIEKETVNP